MYEARIETHTIDGVRVKVYSPAKTIADCFYYQRTVGLDVCIDGERTAIKAVQEALANRQTTELKLAKTAKELGIESVLTKYLAVITP